MPNKIKILFIIESLARGGKERRLSYLLEFLPRYNYEIHLLITDNVITYKNIDFDLVRLHLIEGMYNNRLIFNIKYLKLLNNIKPDIVHSWGQMCTFYSILPKFFFKFKLINSQITSATYLVNYTLKHKFVDSLNFSFSDMIISNSKKGLILYKVKSKNTAVIYNGIEIDKCNSALSRENILDKYKLSGNIFIGMTASFTNQKDWDTFLTAATRIVKKNRKIKFLAIGDGVNKSYFYNNYKSENIIFLGDIDNVMEINKILNIGVLTSFGEGIPNSLIEMMAAKVPVISTNRGAVTELIDDNTDGVLINVSSPDELVSSINTLLKNKKKYEEIRVNGYNKILTKFTLTSMIYKYLEVYKKK